jgi:hypothetical protein
MSSGVTTPSPMITIKKPKPTSRQKRILGNSRAGQMASMAIMVM